jgi:hypothetical protein
MYIDFTRPYFNMAIAACRAAGARGGRRSAQNRRLQKISEESVRRELIEPREETAAEAIARIDALCPWLRGVEIRTSPRRSG